VASEAQCEQAFRALAEMLAGVDADLRGKHVQERTVSCRLPDLGVTWSGRVCEEGLLDLSTDDEGKAQVRFTVSSDDLLALVEHRLGFPAAFATGRLRVQASPMDLLRLGAFL
jgi:predicted lipid carrier protein YhbT